MAEVRIERRSTPTWDELPRDLPPLLRRIYAGRSVGSAQELDYRLENLHTFEALSGIEEAAAILGQAVEEGRHIMIVADYDADGATACALAVRTLRAMGANKVSYLVPDRFKHGYGLTREIAELAKEDLPGVLVTVDNGISSVEGVAHANSLGMEVVITDHHLPGDRLPAAGAIVNPNLPGDRFPSKYLCGAGVMFYVLAALRAELRAAEWFNRQSIPVPNLAALLDLVALGTVADMVPLDPNNRILVAQGLARIHSGKCTPGLSALLRAAKRSPSSATASDLAYFAGPRLNAAGRLTDMRLGIECLLADDEAVALKLAGELDQLNRERRELQARMQQEAAAELDRIAGLADENSPPGLCLFDERWHSGLVGLLASHVKDRLQRPVFVFAREADGMLKGSGRSVDGIHIRDVLADIAAARPDLVGRFGGHAMAAGLSLEEGRFDEFSQCFAEVVAGLGAPAGNGRVLHTDGRLEPGQLNLETAEMLRDAGPWGQAFPEPLFDGEFTVAGMRVIQDRHVKLELDHPGGAPLDAIAFNAVGNIDAGTRRIQLVYRLDVNEFRRRRSVQLVVEHASPVA